MYQCRHGSSSKTIQLEVYTVCGKYSYNMVEKFCPIRLTNKNPNHRFLKTRKLLLFRIDKREKMVQQANGVYCLIKHRKSKHYCLFKTQREATCSITKQSLESSCWTLEQSKVESLEQSVLNKGVGGIQMLL